MATITGFTAARMLQIENSTVVGGFVDLDGRLLLSTRDGNQIDAGIVQGGTGAPGKGIAASFITYQSSASGTESPNGVWLGAPPQVPSGHYLWTRTMHTYTDGTTTTSFSVGMMGEKGNEGAPGPVGSNGQTSYLHVAYASSEDGLFNFSTTDPTGRTHLGTYTDFTAADSPDPTKYTWVLIQGPEGTAGATGPTGAVGKGIASSIVTYKVSTSGTSTPTGTWQTSVPATAVGQFLWTRTTITFDDGAVQVAYSVAAHGSTGPQGIPGLPGADGTERFTWIKYADTPTTGMSDSPTNKTYMGIAYNRLSSTESSMYADYEWSLIRGAQGNQGIQGPPGDDATERFTWIKYANNDVGSGISDDPLNKTYIGIAYNKLTPTESNTPGDYQWSLIQGPQGPQGTKGDTGNKGDKGDTGSAGKGITTSVITYQASSSGTATPTGTWVATPPAVSAGQYLWTRTVLTYTDATTTTSYSVGRMGTNGSQGTQGVPGTNGETSYLHVAYANSADGSNGFSTTDPSGKSYMGTYTDFVAADSSDPTKYEWVLIKGNKGDTGNTGATGKGISSSIVHYQVSSSGTSAPTGTWHTTVQTTAVGQFLWTRTTITFTDGATQITYSVAAHGSIGPQGIQGVPGADGTERFTWIKYADTPTTGMSDLPAGKTYMGIAYNKTSSTESSTYTDYEWSLIRGAQGNQGIQGPPGDDATERFTWIKYGTSASGAGISDDPAGKTYIGIAYNKTTATESSTPGDYQWSLIQGPQGNKGDQGVKGDQGSQGIPGVPGADATERFTWIKYATTPTTGMSDLPDGKVYMGIAYNKTSSTESSNYADYEWSLIQGPQGNTGNTGATGKGISTTAVTYAKSASGTTAPTTGWVTSPIPVTTPGEFLWSRTVTSYTDSTSSTAYSVSAHGATGATGTTGATGRGISSTVVEYNKTATGTIPPTNGWTTSIPVTSPGEFLWTRTIISYTSGSPTTTTAYTVAAHGATGQQGIQGPPGSDGNPTFTWIKYGTNSAGAGISDDPAGKTYIGIAYNKLTANESTNPADYDWSLIQGPQGDTGPKGDQGNTGNTGSAGRGITSTTVTYQKHTNGTTAPTGTWSASVPATNPGDYLWTRTVIAYTDSTNSTSYSVGRIGTNGSNGTPGAAGSDGQTSYLHVAYATNATGTTGFSTTDPSGKTHMGVYVDFVEPDSTDPTKYSWSLIQGPQGNIGSTGPTGKGIASSAIHYQVSASGTTTPTGTWATSMPVVPAGQFLWTRTTITFTDAATQIGYSVARQGVDGAIGAPGSPGVSVTNVIPYFLLTTGGVPAKPTTNPPSGWTSTEPTYTAGSTAKLYVTHRTLLSNGTFSYSDVSLSSSYEASKAAYAEAQLAKTNAQTAQTAADEARQAALDAMVEATTGKVWIQETAPPVGTTHEWLGIINDSPSVKKIDGVEVLRNLMRDGSFEHSLSVPGSNRLVVSRTDSWAKDGSYSIASVRTSDTSSDAYVEILSNVEGGQGAPGSTGGLSLKTNTEYTLQATYNLLEPFQSANEGASGVALNQKLCIFAHLGGQAKGSTNGVNSVGIRTLSHTFTTPPSLSGLNTLRLYAGDVADAPSRIMWDAISLIEGSEPHEFFNGNTPDSRENDLWINTTDGLNTPMKWNHTTKAWSVATDKAAIDAQARADAAHALAGTAGSNAQAALTSAGKRNEMFHSTAVPTGTGTREGDLWHQWDTMLDGGRLLKLWVWRNNEWHSRDLDESYIPLLNIGSGTYGLLEGLRLVAGSVKADRLDADEIWANEAFLQSLRVNGPIDASMITSDFASQLTLENNNTIQLIVTRQAETADAIDATQSDLESTKTNVINAADQAAAASAAAATAQTQANAAVASGAATSAQVQELKTWFRVTADGASVGRSDSDFTANIEPGEFNIKQGSTKRTWWTDNKMVVPVLEATEQITIAKHSFEPFPQTGTATGTVVRRLV